MAATWNSRRLRHERTMDRRFVSEQRALARRIGAIVQRASIGTGDPSVARIVPNTRSAKTALRSAVWRDVLKPYYVGAGDDPLPDIHPQSPYAMLLYDGVYGALLIQAERQAAFINKIVSDETVVQWLTGPRPAGIVSEVRGSYDPWHEWVDPNGYRLSDRIWRTSANARANIDRMLNYHISQGTSAERIAELLEDYMTPGSNLIRTRTPYGKEGSYAARRLARTEISAAAGRGTINAALANPFVGWIQWVLSPAHGCCDICDDNAQGGPNGDGIYAIDAVPAYPAHPHCLCSIVPVPAGNTADLVSTLRDEIRESSPLARQLQGLFEPEYLATALLNGQMSRILALLGELMTLSPELPEAV